MRETSTSPQSGERDDPGADMDCEAGDVVVVDFDLAGVHTGADLDPEALYAVADRAARTTRRGPVRRNER